MKYERNKKSIVYVITYGPKIIRSHLEIQLPPKIQKILQIQTDTTPKFQNSLAPRSSQIACTLTTVHIAFTQTALRVPENLCMVLIPLCKNNLNLHLPHRPLCFKEIKTTTAIPQRFLFPTQ